MRWAFVDLDGTTYGLDRAELNAVFARADLFIDRGLHRTFLEESAAVPLRVLVDPDPGYRQIQMELDVDRHSDEPEFDAYYTYGQNIGTGRSSAPTGGVEWRHLFHPVDVTGVIADRPPAGAPFTTVMNWRSLAELSWEGRSYGMKDKEFPAFADLPSRVPGPFEMAVEGDAAVRDQLRAHGWIAVRRGRGDPRPGRLPCLHLPVRRRVLGPEGGLRRTRRGLVQRPQRHVPRPRPSRRRPGQRPRRSPPARRGPLLGARRR